MKLNANITKVLSEAKSNFSDDEHEVQLTFYFNGHVFCIIYPNFVVTTKTHSFEGYESWARLSARPKVCFN